MKTHRAFAPLALMLSLSAVGALAQTPPTPPPSPGTPAPTPTPPTPAPTPAAPPTAKEAFDALKTEGMGFRDAIRGMVCYADKGQLASLHAGLLAYMDKIHAYETTYFPRKSKHDRTDYSVDRLWTIEQQISDAYWALAKRPCVPPANMVPQPPPPPPSTPHPDVAPEHSSLGQPQTDGVLAMTPDMGRNDWTLLASYSSVDPSPGDNSDLWNFSARMQQLIRDDVAIDVGAGYRNETGSGFSTSEWAADAALVWYRNNMRFGPAVGYERATESHFHSEMWNYGGFFEYFWPHMTANVKAGGFSTNTSFENFSGYYAGGSLTGYLCPNFSLRGGVDYTHISSFGGSGETDWSARATWRPFVATPLAFWAGDTYSTFSPGSGTTNTISIGVMFDLGNGQTLIDSDRGGALVNQSSFPHPF